MILMTHNATMWEFLVCFVLALCSCTMPDGFGKMRFTREYHALSRLGCTCSGESSRNKNRTKTRNITANVDGNGYGAATSVASRSQTHTLADTQRNAICTPWNPYGEVKNEEKKKIDFRSVFWDSPFSWNSFARTADDGSPSQPDICCVHSIWAASACTFTQPDIMWNVLCSSIWFSVRLELNNIALLWHPSFVHSKKKKWIIIMCKALSLGPANIYKLEKKKWTLIWLALALNWWLSPWQVSIESMFHEEMASSQCSIGSPKQQVALPS